LTPSQAQILCWKRVSMCRKLEARHPAVEFGAEYGEAVALAGEE
jgi:hypothetical protein